MAISLNWGYEHTKVLGSLLKGSFKGDIDIDIDVDIDSNMAVSMSWGLLHKGVAGLL